MNRIFRLAHSDHFHEDLRKVNRESLLGLSLPKARTHIELTLQAVQYSIISWHVINSQAFLLYCAFHLRLLCPTSPDKRAFVGCLWGVESGSVYVCVRWGRVGGGGGFSVKCCAATYTWPSSWAIVKEALIPFSSLMEQLRYWSHMVPSSASPKGSRIKKRTAAY